MSLRQIPEITKDNDLTFRVGPIRGVDPADNTIKDWTGTQLSGWITADPTSDTALGGITITPGVLPGAKFVPSFNAPDVNTILTAAGVLADGATLWCVLKGTGDLRVAIQLVYRTARRI